MYIARRRSFSLLELVLVLVVLTAVAGIAVSLGSTFTFRTAEGERSAEHIVTQQTMETMREAIMGLGDPGYWQDRADATNVLDRYPRSTFSDPPQATYLFVAPSSAPDFDPQTRTGWRGPYLQATGAYPAAGDEDRWGVAASARGFTAIHGSAGDPAMLDAWFNPVVIQEPNGAGLTDEERSLYTRLVSAGPNGFIDVSAADTAPADIEPGDDIVLFLRAVE